MDDTGEEPSLEDFLIGIEDPAERQIVRNDPLFRQWVDLYVSLPPEGRARFLRVADRMAALPDELRKRMTDAEMKRYLNDDSSDALN